MSVPLLQAVLDSGAQRAALPYNVVRTIAALDPVVSEVIGTTQYAIKGQYITVTGRSGIAQALPSRTEWDHRLLGTKLLVAEQRQALVAVGRSDGRPVIIVPEITNHHTTGLVLLHVKLHQQLPPEMMKAVLDGYRGRLAILRSAVTEIQPTFDERLLGQLCPLALLTKPAETLADYWCRAGQPLCGGCPPSERPLATASFTARTGHRDGVSGAGRIIHDQAVAMHTPVADPAHPSRQPRSALMHPDLASRAPPTSPTR